MGSKARLWIDAMIGGAVDDRVQQSIILRASANTLVAAIWH